LNQISVLLADDHTIIRDGLRVLLEAHPDIRVIAEADDGLAAYNQVKVHRPQIVLMDIRMPHTDGVEATRLIKRDFPETAVLILTTFDDDELIINAMINGASGYLLKDIGGTRLAESIRDVVLRGSVILPGAIAAKVAAYLVGHGSQSKACLGDFTQREQEIINLLMQGKSNKEISEALFLTVGTVKNYISQIYSKAGITDRANAILYFKEMGF
jgi:DNA-binding NarL/FixJ family response regulator